MTAPAGSRPSTAQAAAGALDLLYQHRLLTTGQLHRLQGGGDRRPVYLRGHLNRLMAAGLVGRVRAHGRNSVRSEYVWFLTEQGADDIENGRTLAVRPYRVSEEAAAGSRQAHTLGLNEVGLAFLEHAQRLGHECGPLDWTPEVAHRLRDGQHGFEQSHVISDAVLDYVHVRPRGARTMLRMFIEYDRSTMTVGRLAGKLSGYARLYTYVPAQTARGRRSAGRTRPAWQYQYPVFPRLLIILDGAGPRALHARTADLVAQARADVRLMRLADRLRVGVSTLDQLRADGPFGATFTPVLRAGQPTDIYLEPRGDEHGSGP